MLDRTGAEDTLALATIGAVPPWKVKSGRSTSGKTRITANKKSSKMSKIQCQRFITAPSMEASYPIPCTLSTLQQSDRAGHPGPARARWTGSGHGKQQGIPLLNHDPILWSMLNAIKEQQALIHKQQEQITAQRPQIKAPQAQSRLQQAELASLASEVKAIQASLQTSGANRGNVRRVKNQANLLPTGSTQAGGSN